MLDALGDSQGQQLDKKVHKTGVMAHIVIWCRISTHQNVQDRPGDDFRFRSSRDQILSDLSEAQGALAIRRIPAKIIGYNNPRQEFSRKVSKKMTKYATEPLTQDKANPVLLLRVINRIHKKNVVKL